MEKNQGKQIAEKKGSEKLKLLFALIRNSRQKDRELAKNLHLSQTTITKRRKELEQKGFITQYTVLPNLEKMGYEIVALVFHSWTIPPTPESIQLGREWLKTQPSIVFAALGEGSADNFILSVHRNYADFSAYLLKLRETMYPSFSNMLHFVVDIKKGQNILKTFSPNCLIDAECQ